MQRIIGLVGFIGSGKDTVADILVEKHNFERISFAKPLKDAVAAIFGWDRDMLEGRTTEARAQREVVDAWWQDRIGDVQGKPVTPRHILQLFGSEVVRDNVHEDIWVHAAAKYIAAHPEKNFVFTDVRFANELEMIEQASGIIVKVFRHADPPWLADYLDMPYSMFIGKHNIHHSETGWIKPYLRSSALVLFNDSTLEKLADRVGFLVASYDQPKKG